MWAIWQEHTVYSIILLDSDKSRVTGMSIYFMPSLIHYWLHIGSTARNEINIQLVAAIAGHTPGLLTASHNVQHGQIQQQQPVAQTELVVAKIINNTQLLNGTCYIGESRSLLSMFNSINCENMWWRDFRFAKEFNVDSTYMLAPICYLSVAEGFTPSFMDPQMGFPSADGQTNLCVL